MIDQHTDFFKYVDNFAKTAHIPSIPIFESTLDYIPEITIAIPTYKRADLLKEAIDSAINQIDYTNYDIIVVDNNPERGCETEKLMMSYNNPKISYYKNADNLGMVGNWNRLFTLAKGKYVVMLHDDDLLLPYYLKECMFIINNVSDVGILKPQSKSFTNRVQENIQENIISNNISKIKRLYDISNYYSYALGAPTGCVFKKEYVLTIGGFNPEFYPTMDLCFVSLFSLVYKVYTFGETLVLYRWSVNETLNLSTLNGFIINDYYYRFQLLRKYYLPRWFIQRYLYVLTCRKINLNKKINPNFTFDKDILDIKPVNNRFADFFIHIMRFYVFTLICIKNISYYLLKK